jgi:hypothetical protein
MRSFAREADRAEILERLTALRVDSERRWGTMTVHQMVIHCAKACRMAHGDLTPRELTPSWSRPVIKVIALYAPMRWPRGIQTVPEFDQVASAAEPASEFAADVAELAALLVRITVRQAGPPWPRHPIFGPMSERAWLRWAWLHMDHHLRQFGA